MAFRNRLILLVLGFLLLATKPQTASAVIRDGGIDPTNLGQIGWIYKMYLATNHLSPSSVPSVVNELTMFQYLKSQGMTCVIVKAGMTNKLWTGVTAVPIGDPSAQFTSSLCNAAHAAGLKIFGSNRSGGDRTDDSVVFDDALIQGEIAVADYVFQQGADGFIWDAEDQWEGLGAEGQRLAWLECSTVRSHWPTKFLAHNPYDTAMLHSSFPFKEFGYWADCVIPQTYHHSASKGNAFAAITWTDAHFKKLYDNFRTMAPSIIDGQTINWTNSIKPIFHMRDVSSFDQDLLNFVDYTVADPNAVTPGSKSSSYFRSELHTPAQWAFLKQATIGNFPGVVNNIILDDNVAVRSGGWSLATTISANTSTVTFGSGTDTNSFGTNYWYKGKGAGSSVVQFNPNVLTAGDYNCYEWHPYRVEASAGVPVTVSYDAGTDTVYMNQKTNAGYWSFIGKFPFAAGTNGYIRYSDSISEAAGIAMVDGLKMVFVPPVSVPAAPTGLTAGALTGSTVTLTWNDNSANETGFVILRGTVNGGPYTGIGLVGRNVTTFTDTNATPGASYYYVVRGTNYLGASPNSNQVSPLGAPVIVKQPQPLTVGQFSPASFSVTATNGILSYQWRKDGNPLSNAGTFSGVDTATLLISSAVTNDAGLYSVFISNAAGSTTSISVTLTVATIPPSIVSQPQNQVVSAGSAAVISVVANGTQPLTYIWKKNGTTTLVDGASVTGATTSSFTLLGVLKANEGNYSVTVTNLYGTVTSSNAFLTVLDPAITLNPTDLSVIAGQTAVFTVNASGTPNLTFLWKKNGTNMVNGGKISGANTSSLSISNALFADVANYTVQVSNGISNVVSTPVTLYVTDPIILTNPISRTNVAGTTATFTVAPYGTTPMSYAWKKNGNFLSNDGRITGVNTSTLTIANVSQADATAYSVVVSNISSSTVSGSANLTVIDPPAITQQPQSISVIRGSNITFTVTATGTQPMSYQWRFNGTNILGAIKSSYSLSNVQTNSNGDYSVLISNAGGSLASSNATLIVTVPFEIFNLQPITRANSVVVNWATTSNSTSQVEYGLTPAKGYFSPLITTPVTNHSVLLTSLKPDTTYYIRVISQIGSVTISSNATFFTSSSIILDNPVATYTGAWTYGTGSTDRYGDYYEYTLTATNAGTYCTATYTPNITIPGKYDVYIWYGKQSARTTNLPVTIYGSTAIATARVNQTTNTGSWQPLTKNMDFAAGTGGYATLNNNTGETNKIAVADAFMWQYSIAQDIRTDGTVPDWWANFYFGTANINPLLDDDGDGLSTFAEYIIGTTPTDPLSKLDFHLENTGTNIVRATFSPVLPGRNYELRSTTDLSSQVWTNTPCSLVLSNGYGVLQSTNFNASPTTFYRLSVNLDP